jgi:pyruvate,water dikinase
MRSAVRRLRSLFGWRRRTRTVEEFERMFRQFREVLDGNNSALEIITEMGEVLGGDYLFDLEYIKRARAALAASVDRSLRVFGELTEGRYRRLPEVAASIDAMIGRVVDETPPPPAAFVFFHEDITPDRAAAVGGKNAQLALLRNAAKLDVPDGFAITTRAFDAFVRHNGLGKKLQPPSGETPRPEELRELVVHGEIPPDLGRAIEEAIGKLRARCDRDCSLAVRSSAEHEDGEHSFAGQFETVLNVPLRRDAVEDAYRQVIASLFSPKAAAYQQHLGYSVGATKMAVTCMVMVDAAVSGVLYTSNPLGGTDGMVISASWGLGTTVVDGRADADHIVVAKDGTGSVVEETIGEKAVMTVLRAGGGTEETETPEDERRRRSLDRDQLARLVDAGLVIERHFRSPQDVEWAFDASGRMLVLQSRPLGMQGAASPERPPAEPPPAAQRIALRNGGTVVQEGAAAGKVYVLKSMRDLDAVPRGAVLVTRHDASAVVRVMPLVSAILTDTGAPTSHMASLSREFRIPTIVNTGDATRVLADGQEVTVMAAREGAAVYRGLIASSLATSFDASARMEDLHEFRRRRYVLWLIAPLNLVDPLRDDFTPEACRTIHDVLRFMHEKSVARLIEGAGLGAGARGAVKLDLSIPAGIAVIDIGGGLENPEGRRARLEQITSLPFRALAEGMTHPGVWRSEAVPLSTSDFMSSMLSVPDLVTQGGSFGGTNFAVISREYANVNVKFGYHYAILDCYCSATPRNNHVTFRFAGGATDITKRSRRLQFIATVLEEHGFNVATKGDLILGRLANVRREDMIGILDQLGRLLAYTRQLDAVLHDGREVERLAKRFLSGVYDLTQAAGGSNPPPAAPPPRAT